MGETLGAHPGSNPLVGIYLTLFDLLFELIFGPMVELFEVQEVLEEVPEVSAEGCRSHGRSG